MKYICVCVWQDSTQIINFSMSRMGHLCLQVPQGATLNIASAQEGDDEEDAAGERESVQICWAVHRQCVCVYVCIQHLHKLLHLVLVLL